MATELSHTVLILISSGAFALSILVHIIAYAKTWGSIRQIHVGHEEAIGKINRTLFGKDMTPNFVTKKDFDDHAKNCPVIICARINDVKNVVEKYIDLTENDRLSGVRLQESMKQVNKTLDKQGIAIDTTLEKLEGINMHLVALNGKKWDGENRRSHVAK